MSSCLTVGPVRFILREEDSSSVRYDDWAYRGFFSGEPSEEICPPQAELDVRIVRGSPECPGTQPRFEAGKNWAVWPDGDGWLFCSGFAGRERPGVSYRVSRDLDRAVLYVDGDPGDAPLRYPLDQILTWGLLARCGAILLHAAAVVRDGSAFVLAGRSGAGKSTLAALCRAEGWRVLNDDRTVLFRRDGRVFAAGTPWHGSGRFAEADEAPLSGLYLLSRSRTNRIERLDPVSARLSLLEAASIPWFEDRWSQGALDALDQLLRDVPVYRFHFTRTSAAVQMLEGKKVLQAEAPV